MKWLTIFLLMASSCVSDASKAENCESQTREDECRSHDDCVWVNAHTLEDADFRDRTCYDFDTSRCFLRLTPGGVNNAVSPIYRRERNGATELVVTSTDNGELYGWERTDLDCQPISGATRETRAETRRCNEFRPPFEDPGVSPKPEDECAADSDCQNGENGRCRYDDGIASEGSEFRCTYDQCFADDDCGIDEVCACGSDGMLEGFVHDENRCVPANCVSDDDCDGFCQRDPTRCVGATRGYYCTTPNDSCATHEDCGPNRWCGYSEASLRWECVFLDCG